MESTALHLESRGDLRTLICFVERWSEYGEPSPAARLAQARALVSLGLMDRAWARLQGLVDTPDATVAAAAVAATMLLERGWTKQARRALVRVMGAHPDDPTLQALWARASEPYPHPDLDAAELETASASARLVAAEHHIASGAFVRARALLERVRREDPDGARAEDLLWALDGDFAIEGSLAELTDRHGPDLTDLTDFADESEHTATLRPSGSAEREGPSEGSSSFPVLFRHLEPRTEMHKGLRDEPEVTQLSSLAAIDELRRAAMTDIPATTGDDTQILRVVHRAGSSTASEEGSGETGSFDLAAFRREMGMHFAPSSDLAGPPEIEDDDLIVLTRREETQEVTETTSASVSLDLKPEEAALPPKNKAVIDEDARWAQPAPEPAPEAPSPELDERFTRETVPALGRELEAPRPPRRQAARPVWPMGLAALGGVLLVSGGLIVLLVVLRILSAAL